jgi:enolase
LSYLIKSLNAREILDSRGNPTLEVEVKTRGGYCGRAAVPSGASTGLYEAVELRDRDERFHGKGLLKAIKNIKREISKKLIDLDVREQKKIDEIMISLDGTSNKKRLGGNTILGVSLACAKAAAIHEGLELYEYINSEASLMPLPFFNVINGGKHAGNELDFQEFMIVPSGAETFREALRMGSETYHVLKKQLRRKYGENAINVGDEGGFTPPINDTEEAIIALIEAIEEVGYKGKIELAMDIAASTFFKKDKYLIENKVLSTDEIINFYFELVKKYPIISIEDPLEENDFKGFAKLSKKIPIQIIGDDIYVTNPKRLKKGINIGAGNTLLLKVNQIGTLTEALEAAKIAKDNNWGIQVSHRSGETEDTFIADLAVGIESGQIKAGAPARGERTSKYNRLLRIEDKLNEKARFPHKIH